MWRYLPFEPLLLVKSVRLVDYFQNLRKKFCSYSIVLSVLLDSLSFLGLSIWLECFDENETSTKDFTFFVDSLFRCQNKSEWPDVFFSDPGRITSLRQLGK